jgi:hypothetical protein
MGTSGNSSGDGGALSSWPVGVSDKLGFYVYRLVDPRSGNTFYVGKGRGDRVFAHMAASVSVEEFDDEQLDPKLATIHEIRALGLKPSHVIHRHGLDEGSAFEVEAALMDAYPGLANVQGGRGSRDRGAMHATEIVNLYARSVADFHDHKLLIIKINKSLEEGKSVYDAVRVAWRVNVDKARKAEWVLAAHRGIILDVFQVEEWLPALHSEFEGLNDPDNDVHRWGFKGRPAPEPVRERWRQQRLPDELMKPGPGSVRYWGFDGG